MASKGNQNAIGNKGGGRSKKGDEDFLLDLWNGKIKKSKIKIAKKKETIIYQGKKLSISVPMYKSGKDAFAIAVLSGSQKELLKLVDKLYADRRLVEGDPDNPIQVGVIMLPQKNVKAKT